MYGTRRSGADPLEDDAATRVRSVGNLFGVAAKAAAEAESVEIATVGVYELPKLASAVIAAGDRVSWDDIAKEVVVPGTGMVTIGIATVAAGNGVATVRVRLDGIATAAA